MRVRRQDPLKELYNEVLMERRLKRQQKYLEDYKHKVYTHMCICTSVYRIICRIERYIRGWISTYKEKPIEGTCSVRYTGFNLSDSGLFWRKVKIEGIEPFTRKNGFGIYY